MAQKKLDLNQIRKFRLLLDARTEEMAHLRRNLKSEIDNSGSYWKDDRRAGIEAKLSVFTKKMEGFEYKAKEFSKWLLDREIKGDRFLKGR